MTLLSPVKDTALGLAAYWRGVRWLRAHPGYLMMVFFPMILGVFTLFGGLAGLLVYGQDILNMMMFEQPSSWWGIALYYIVAALLYVALVVFALVASILVVNVVASPIYEIVSVAVEADVTGRKPPELSLWASLRLVGEELKKVIFILGITFVSLFIPGINVLSALLAAFLVGWDSYDYSLARRGYKFRQRLEIVRTDIWKVMGFGLWLVIPFVQVVLIPMAVAGGTLMSLERCEDLTPKNRRMD